MAISTLQPQQTKSQLLMYALALVGIGLLIYFGGSLIQGIGDLRGKAGLSVSLKYGNADIELNGAKVGSTPVELQNVKPGDNKVTIKNETRRYETSFNFIPNWHVVVIRDLGTSDVSSSGQNTWMEKNNSGTVFSVISEPAGASVYIDNTEIGKTPFSSNKLADGDYDLRIQYLGYEDEGGRIKIVKGNKLNISVNLFPMPTPSQINLMEGSQNLYNVALDNPLVFSDTEAWAKALLYWNKTRGINIAGAGLNKEMVFDYLLDYKGNIYNKDGAMVTDTTQYMQFKDAKKGAYLGKVSDGNGLTEQARKTYEILMGAAAGKKVKIKETGTGWLRVRDLPSINGKEISKVNVGKIYSVLEEKNDSGGTWTKIEITVEGKITRGWISSDFVMEVK